MYEKSQGLSVGHMEASMQDQPIRGSSAPIALQMDHLKTEIEEAHRAAGDLICRLSPILGPSTPEKDAAGNRVSPATSPLADMLESLAYSVRGIRERIASTIDRIEL